MGGKHLKRLRLEKSKVHLKKKKLPKGQNLTSTTFTVKKISTVEQLRKVEEDEPVSNWKIPLKDLFIRLNHYNITSKLNSMNGIKELLIKYPDILRGPMLKPLISRVLELLSDEEHKIRVSAIDLLSYLFGLIPSSSIAPFHEILVLHLGCAMTHRNTSVQQDSLKFIDVLLTHAPGAIKCNFKSIMQNFLRILKSNFHESHVRAFSSGKSRKDVEKAKREMLVRFHQILIVGYISSAEDKQYEFKSINVDVLRGNKVSIKHLCDQYKKIPYLSVFKNSENKVGSFKGFDSEEFMNLCSQIMPLMFDAWKELFPSNRFNEDSSECMLSDGIGELLSVVLKILMLLFEIATTMQNAKLEIWFKSNYSSTFKKCFTSNFPFFPPASMKKSKNKDFSELPKEWFNVYIMSNLMICYLAYSFKVVEKDSKLEARIENYISDALLKSTGEVEIFSKALNAAIFASDYKKTNNVFNRVVEAYNETTCLELRRSLSKILLKVILEENKKGTHLDQKNECIRNWMKSLPDRLCESQVFIEELEAILKLITTFNGAELLSEIEFKSEKIVENLKNVRVEGMSQVRGQKMIVDILYRCSNTVLMEIMKKNILSKSVCCQDLKDYIADVFSQKLEIVKQGN